MLSGNRILLNQLLDQQGDEMEIYNAHHAHVMASVDRAFKDFPLAGEASRDNRNAMVHEALDKAESALGGFVSLSKREQAYREVEMDFYRSASEDVDADWAKESLGSLLHIYFAKMESRHTAGYSHLKFGVRDDH